MVLIDQLPDDGKNNEYKHKKIPSIKIKYQGKYRNDGCDKGDKEVWFGN